MDGSRFDGWTRRRLGRTAGRAVGVLLALVPDTTCIPAAS